MKSNVSTCDYVVHDTLSTNILNNLTQTDLPMLSFHCNAITVYVLTFWSCITFFFSSTALLLSNLFYAVMHSLQFVFYKKKRRKEMNHLLFVACSQFSSAQIMQSRTIWSYLLTKCIAYNIRVNSMQMPANAMLIRMFVSDVHMFAFCVL